MDEFRVVVANLDGWMANSSPPWATYHALMSCYLVALDKRPWVSPVGIVEALRHAIAKLVMRAAGDQANRVCGSLQMCAGLAAGIEGDTHAEVARERHAGSRRRSR